MLLSVTLPIQLWHLISETTLSLRILPNNRLLQDLLYQLPIRTFLSPNQQQKWIYLSFSNIYNRGMSSSRNSISAWVTHWRHWVWQYWTLKLPNWFFRTQNSPEPLTAARYGFFFSGWSVLFSLFFTGFFWSDPWVYLPYSCILLLERKRLWVVTNSISTPSA